MRFLGLHARPFDRLPIAELSAILVSGDLLQCRYIIPQSLLNSPVSYLKSLHTNKLVFHIYHRCYLAMLISRLYRLLPFLTAVSALPSIPPLALTSTLPVNSNFSLGETVECFNAATRYDVLTIRDCIRAADLIRTDPLYGFPRRWSVPRSAGQLTKYWTWGECGIALIARSVPAEDVFSLTEVLHHAILILHSCVASYYKRGGRMKVGPERDFLVAVRYRIGAGD